MNQQKGTLFEFYTENVTMVGSVYLPNVHQLTDIHAHVESIVKSNVTRPHKHYLIHMIDRLGDSDPSSHTAFHALAIQENAKRTDQVITLFLNEDETFTIDVSELQNVTNDTPAYNLALPHQHLLTVAEFDAYVMRVTEKPHVPFTMMTQSVTAYALKTN